MAASGFISCHRLYKRSFRCLYSSCEKIAHSWEDLATRLDLDRDTVKTIGKDTSDSKKSLRGVLDDWLNESKHEIPSWKAFCEALLHVDRPLSESIYSQHLCGCSLCNEDCSVEKPVIGLVIKFYERINQLLDTSDIIQVAKDMQKEGAFTDVNVQDIEKSKDNEAEMFFVTLESALTSKCYNLKIFGTVLKTQQKSYLLGKNILSKYDEANLLKHPGIKEFVVDRKYKKEFTSLRTKLGILCTQTIELLNKRECELLTVKFRLAFSFPELKLGLDNCDSLEEVISDVIRPQLSLIQIDFLQSVHELFKLSMEPIEEYEEVIREFCERMKLQHTYGQMLMDELKSHVSVVESITFVLRWNGEKESLHDLQDLFDEVVRELKEDIKVIVMHQGNSTVVECFVRLRYMPRVLEALNKERPLHPAIMRIIAQGKEVYNTSSDTGKLPVTISSQVPVTKSQHSAGKKRIKFKLPTVPNHIKRTLERYPDGPQVLKELVQNADDAEATEIKFILDSRQYSTVHLIDRKLNKFQGPALYAWNNAVFTNEDWDNFGKIEDSSKEMKSLKIGKFGIGFISIFHLTDLPLILSADTAVIIDPQTIAIDEGGWNDEIDFFLQHQSHAESVSSFIPSGTKYYDGTLFRFPLRVDESEISSSPYSVERVKDFLFKSFMKEAAEILLFLNHIQEISMYDNETLLYRISIHPDQKRVVSSERNDLIKIAQSIPLHPYLRIYSMSISIESSFEGNQSFHWLVINMIGFLKDLDKFQTSLKLAPWVGVATALPDKCNLSNVCLHEINISEIVSKLPTTIKVSASPSTTTSTNGLAFCSLPLSLPTHLPIHIHGCFALTDNRNCICWPSAKSNKSDMPAIWNQKLVCEFIVPIYSVLIACRSKLITYKKSISTSDIRDAYVAWPVWADVKNEEIWSELVKPTIHGIVEEKVFWSITTNKWVSRREAIFLPPSTDSEIPQSVVELMTKTDAFPVIRLPDEIWQTLKKLQLLQHVCAAKVSPTHVRQAFKGAKMKFDSIESFYSFLEYLMQDIRVVQGKIKNLNDLLGLKIIPLAMKRLTLQPAMASGDDEDIIYFLTEDMTDILHLLPGLETSLVSISKSKYPNIYQKFYEFAKSKQLQIRLITQDIFCQRLLLQSIKTWSAFKPNHSLAWNMKSPKCPEFQWIKKVWDWLRKDTSIVLKTVGVPILPKEVINEDTLACTLLPMPSSTNKYFCTEEKDTPLVKILQNLEANVIEKNDFVFYNGKLSNCILTPTIPNVLHYLKGKEAKVNCLENNDKDMLLSLIAQYYSVNTSEFFTCTYIRELPIFPVGITVTQLKFLPLNPADYILPPMSMLFNEDLQYPPNVINIQNRKDVFNLLTQLLKYKVTPSDEIYIVILKYAIDQLKGSSVINNGDKLIIWILKMYHNLSKKVLHFLESETFVRTSQNSKALKKPKELFNPENETFQELFDAETEETFPHDHYVDEGVMDVLMKLGLINWPRLVGDGRLFCIFLQERAKKVKKMPKRGISMGKHILEIIADHPKHCLALMQAVESVQFLKAEDSKPHDFPSCLPWFGEEKKIELASPISLCYDENVAKLVGSVLPIIHREYRCVQLPDVATKRFLIPEVKTVLKQLKILVKMAPNFDENDMHTVSEIVRGIYTFLDEHASTLQSVVYALPKKWIWWNHRGKYCFLSSDCFVRESQIDLEPYLYCIKTSGTLNYPKLLQKSDIRPHPTPEQLVEVLKSISVPLNARDTKISISILGHLYEQRYKKTSSDLLVPTVDEQLLPVKQCTFDDREWVKEKNVCDFPGIYFVHRDIPASHAEYFGVQPLSLQVAPSKELEIKYCKVGQKESLAQRLHGIVNDYCGKIDVFKELLQNADDAKASKVVFLLDWRQHGTTSLFNDKMKCWQGPALIAYNNSTFSDEDLQNICKLAGESKRIDPYKTGQYGLGFCSCYTLTDVPSFISKCFLTIFDPHTHFLGNRVSQVNRGMQIDLFTEKDGLSIYKDQLAPYDNLFGFNLDDMDADGFNGTLFRFPLRTSECPRSEISDACFDKKRMSKRVRALKKEVQSLLLFLKHVQSLEFFELQENESKMQLLFKVMKKDSNSKRVHLLQTYLSKTPYSILKPICCDCKVLTEIPGEKSMELDYLIASAVVGDSIQQNMIPFAEVAVEMKDGIPINSTEGKQIFCFLPLPLKVQLPFYINGYFEVQKDRQSLKELHDSDHQSWNAIMMEYVIPTVIEYLLETLTEKSLEASSSSEFLKNYYSLWCVEAVREVSSLVDLLKHSIHRVLKQSDKSLLWSEAGGGVWVPVSQACLFDDRGSSLPPNIASSAIEVLISLGHHMIKCPDNIRRLITESDPDKIRVFDYSFLLETLLTNILNVRESDYILHLNYLIQNVTSDDPHNIILKLKEGMQDTPLNDYLIDFVSKFMQKQKLDSASNMFLPDSENILQEATTLFCNSSLEDTKFEKRNLRFVHESISREVALNCGVQSVQLEILKDNEDTDFLKETAFSKHPNLVGELNKILKETQYSESLLTEFIKLAENAEVNKTAFILDNRTDYPDTFLLSESDEWKNLQHTPALCIFYDKCFDKKRFEDFCTVVNCEHLCATGQFNVAYHLTDCPMLVSFDNNSSPVQFCVFDPLQKYCTRPNSNIPGRRWFGKMVLSQFQDQFKPFLLDKFKEMKKFSSCFSGLSNGFTVIRLPICHFKSRKEKWLNQGKIRDVLQVNECITKFNHTQGNALLFLKHLSCLSIFEIEEVGKLIHHLSLTSTKHIVPDQSTFKVELSSSERDKPSLWLVNEHSALPSQKKSIPGMRRCGNTAIELECSSESMKGSLFCMLSVNIDTSVPVHMNADFLLDSCKHQVSLAVHAQNEYIFEHILIPSYIKLLHQAREYVNVDKEDNIQWYYSLFPRTLESSRTRHVLPVIRDLWKLFYTILVKSDSLILLSQSRWLQVSKGLFFLHTNEHSVCQTLCSLGMPITCAPRFVYDNISKIYQPYQNQGIVTSQTMCSYLKSIKRFSDENLAVIADQCEHLLEFFLQGVKEQDAHRMLTGVPLLLTLKNTVIKSGSLYESEFVQLLPESLRDKFIQPKLENSELIGHKLKQLKIVTALPVDVVAENMLLDDTDKKAVNLDLEETELVTVLWTYLEKNQNHFKAFSKLFDKKPIVPSSSGFVPLCLSKHIFADNRDRVLLKKLGFPILDVSKLGFSKPPEVMVSLISNTIANPQDIVSSMQLSPPTIVGEFTRNEVDRLVFLLNECEDIPSSVLKRLPLFQTVDNQYHCISEARHHIIVDTLPITAGLKVIQDRSQTLIFRSPNQLLNKVLGSKLHHLTDIEVYTQVILPYVEVCTDDEIWEHLTVVKNWIYNPKCKESFKKEIVKIIKNKKIICKSGQRYSVSELYDPDVSFHSEFNKTMLAPDNCTGEWLSFLQLLGLQSEVATDSWCHMATQVASDGSLLSHHRTVQNDTTRKSDVLLESLHKIVAKEMKREKDHAEFIQFLTTIAEIKFIYNRNGNQLCKCLSTITDRDHEENCRSFICFKGAVIVDNGQRVHLLKADVLPQSCEFILSCPSVVRHSLSIQKLSNSMIVENLIALSKSLYNVNNQAFVPSSTKKSAIEEVKKTFELYYRFLNDQSDLEQNLSQDTSSVRCIFICPNEFSFQLLQPSQVVMKMSTDATDLKPFCYPIPQNLQVHSNLWHALGIKDEVDSFMCLQILSNIKEEMEQSGMKKFQENDPFWNVCKSAYNRLILLSHGATLKFPKDLKILLPSDDRFLLQNSKLVFGDVPRIEKMLRQWSDFNFKFLLPPQPNQLGEINPPPALNVKLVSDITSEELHPHVFSRLNQCTEQELFESRKRKFNCETTEKISRILQSEECQSGLARLYWHEQKKDPISDLLFQKKLQELKDLIVFCRRNIKTAITFDNRTIPNTENSNYHCYLSKRDNKLHLYIVHNPFPDVMFWEQLATCLSKHFNKSISASSSLISILACHTPDDIPLRLDELEISKRDKNVSTPENVDIGEEIPFKINQTEQDLLIFCNFDSGEKVLYHGVHNKNPVCKVARIISCPVENSIKLDERLVRLQIDKSTAINVSLLQICKILNASQRQKLLHNEILATQFFEPLILAQLPEDLKSWISETFRHNSTMFRCSTIQLAKRILSHIHYSFTEKEEDISAFLTMAKNALDCIHNERDKIAVIKFVESLKNVPNDFLNQPATQTVPMMGAVPYPQHSLYTSMYNVWPPALQPLFEPPSLMPPEPQLEQKVKMHREHRPRYRLVLVDHSVRESHPDQIVAKAWLQQAKADYMAALDTLVQLTIDDGTREIGEEELSMGPYTNESNCKYPALVCFLCHDVLEKCIKGIMYMRMGVPSNLLHCKNLYTLLSAVEMKDSTAYQQDPLIQAVQSCVASISVHGNRSRYPNYHYPPFSPAALYSQVEAAECLKSVKTMMDLLLQDENISELLGNMDEIGYDRFKTALSSIGNKDLPEIWTKFSRQDGNFKLVLLDDVNIDVEEYSFVAGLFEATLPQYTIERVERIQNKVLWDRYYHCALRMKEHNDGVINETTLFHGTSKTDPDQIYQGDAGFDMKYSKDGFWGKGNYFAVNASFSDAGYAHVCGDDNLRQILVAHVLTGYTYASAPDRSLRKPPVRGTIRGVTRQHDSVCGMSKGSKVFITYENDRAYPAYLITYSI